jgi:hypothetical protein
MNGDSRRRSADRTGRYRVCEVAPERAVPVHDGRLNSMGLASVDGLPEMDVI